MTAESAAPATQTGRWHARRHLPAALLLLAVLGGASGIYFYRQPLLQWCLEALLPNHSLSLPNLSGVRFSLTQANMHDVQFSLQSAIGSASVQLQDMAVTYALKSGKLDSVNVSHAKIGLVYQPDKNETQDPADAHDALIPELPISQLNIQALELEIESPSGKISFTGQARLFNEADRLEAVFQEAEQTIRLNVDRKLNTANLSIEQAEGNVIARLDYRQTDQKNYQAKLDANAISLLNWLTTTSLIPWSIQSDLASSALNQSIQALTSIRLNLQARSNDGLKNLKGRMLLTRNGDYLSSTDITLNTQKTRVTADGHLDMALADALTAAGPWLPAKSQDWQTSSGRVIGTFRVKWQPQTQPDGEFYLRSYDFGGRFGPAQLQDGFARLDVTSLAPLKAALEIELARLQLGKETTLEHIQVKAGLKKEWLSIEKAELPVFGGVLSVLPIRVNLEKEPVNLTLGIDKFDLEQLLDSLNYPQLSGTGIISGKLPLRLAKDSVEVTNGTLNGLRPGVLHYQGPIADESNIAFKALRNLRYHNLQGKLDYQPNGDYRLGLRLEGKNPEVFSGHAVAFNLNLTGQLPELLQKGLLAGGDFDQPILEQIKKNGKP